MHAENLVKEYHQYHPLNSVKRAVGRGTKKLVHALLVPTSSLSPIDRIKTWLLASALEAPFPHTHAVPPPTNKYSGSPPISLWPSKPSKLFKNGSQGQVQETPGNSYNSSCISYVPTYKVGKVMRREATARTLKDALLRTLRPVRSLKIPLCPTPPSGRGCPR